MIKHTIEMVGFDKPLLDPKEVQRGLEGAAKEIKKSVSDDIRANHHASGQLEESLLVGQYNAGNQSIEIRFRGIRDRDKRKNKISNAQVAYYLDKMKAALAKDRFAGKASAAFAKGLKK